VSVSVEGADGRQWLEAGPAASGTYRLHLRADDPGPVYVQAMHPESTENAYVKVGDEWRSLAAPVALGAGVWTVRVQPAGAPPMATQLTAYPNPIVSSAQIEYALDAAGLVELAVYDVLGRRVETLVSRALSPGRYQTVWKTGTASPGTYFLVLQTPADVVSVTVAVGG
ncbi:MAG: T9SS type A sorting domain-containing protein, partial [Bacteroidota bacterium]